MVDHTNDGTRHTVVVGLGLCRDLDTGATSPTVAHRVVDQVGQDAFEQSTVGVCPHSVEGEGDLRDGPTDPAHRGRCTVHHLDEVGARESWPHGTCREPRRVEQISDKRRQVVDRLVDCLEEF
ncbi:Uncharacterised protein [Mycobacteroides abscessus subsp. abscessus]|nr:Uncharacterised protein [Mycobacteroides abscessus subsp. abscessus]